MPSNRARTIGSAIAILGVLLVTTVGCARSTNRNSSPANPATPTLRVSAATQGKSVKSPVTFTYVVGNVEPFKGMDLTVSLRSSTGKRFTALRDPYVVVPLERAVGSVSLFANDPTATGHRILVFGLRQHGDDLSVVHQPRLALTIDGPK